MAFFSQTQGSATSAFGRTQVRSTEPFSITRRRIVDEARAELDQRVKSDFHVNESAKWEVRTAAAMKRAAVANIARSLKQRDQAALEARRNKLRTMLTAEDEGYRIELASQAEAPADRAKRLVKEARRRKEEREEKRKQFVEEQLERQWKDGCDDLRTIDSQFFNLHCRSEVLKQVEDHKMRQMEQEADRSRWANEWESARLKGMEMDKKHAEARAQALLENRRDLRRQMEEQQEARRREMEQLAQDKAFFQKILAMDAEAAKHKAEMEHERKRQLQRETAAYNEALQKQREEAYRLQREQDKADLWAKMEEFKEDTRRAEGDKEAQRRDMREYREYLAKRREEERLMERELDRLVQEDLDRSNLARDLQWERERLARERLMAEVHQTRAQQIAEKQRRKLREEEEVFMEKRAAELDVARAHEEERREIEEQKQQAQRRLRDLDSQVSINRERARLQREEAMAELRAAEQAEKEYRAKLEAFRVATIEQSKRNYGIKSATGAGHIQPAAKLQYQSRP